MTLVQGNGCKCFNVIWNRYTYFLEYRIICPITQPAPSAVVYSYTTTLEVYNGLHLILLPIFPVAARVGVANISSASAIRTTTGTTGLTFCLLLVRMVLCVDRVRVKSHRYYHCWYGSYLDL